MKSGLIRRKITEDRTDTDAASKILLFSDIPGGAEAFEKAVKFCYGINFEITVGNVVELLCAAKYLEMTEEWCEDNLATRADEFLKKAALIDLLSSLTTLRSCERFLPLAEDMKIVQRCVDVVALKACNESNFPTRSPPIWWAFELSVVCPVFLHKIITSMRFRGANSRTLSIAITAYAQQSLADLLPPSQYCDSPPASSISQKTFLESLISILPLDITLPIGFLCCLLRATIFLNSSTATHEKLERAIAEVLDQAVVGDLLTISLDYNKQNIVGLVSIFQILSGFVDKERKAHGGNDILISTSKSMQTVVRTVDSYVGDIATDENLSVSKFVTIAGIFPTTVRRFDDDLYRAVDIYLKAHPDLDELEKEKTCSVMDPLKLSYEARLHASKNKRLPMQILLQTLYYDQLKLTSAGLDNMSMVDNDVAILRGRIKVDTSLAKENVALKLELDKMKAHVSQLEKGQSSSSSKKPNKFLSTISKKFEKLRNHFTSKDTSAIVEHVAKVAKPKKRRFSMS